MTTQTPAFDFAQAPAHGFAQAPKLRFPEFSDKWEVKKLGDLLEFKNGINADKEQYGSGAKFINVLDILNNDFITHDKIIGSVNVDNQTLEKYLVSYGDILFQRSSETREEVGTANVYLDETKTATFGGFVIRGKKIGEYNPVFLNKLLKTDSARDNITSKSGGSTRYNVGQEILSSVGLLFPQLPEQTKIANFLTAIDEKIQALKQKKTLLKQYKKGIMQQIFSPRRDKACLVFTQDDGTSFPDWEEKSLGEICELTSSKRVYLSDYVNEGIPFYRGKEITELKQNIQPKDILYITEKAYFDFKEKYGVPQINDILMTAVGTLGNVLRIKTDKPFYFKDGNLIWFRKITEYSPFLEIILENNKKDIEKTAIGSTQKALTMVELRKNIFLFPSLPEQQKIANFLTAIDEKIEKVSQQITATETYKKGLLQAMFC